MCVGSTITRNLYLYPYDFYSNSKYMSEKNKVLDSFSVFLFGFRVLFAHLQPLHKTLGELG